MEFFDDDRLRSQLTPQFAVQVMLDALADQGSGVLTGPVRIHADVGAGVAGAGGMGDRGCADDFEHGGDLDLIFTVGANADAFGYRAYAVSPSAGSALGAPEQVTVAHDRQSGRVRAISVGNVLGPRRTGALGGAAARLLSRPAGAQGGQDRERIGTGRLQAGPTNVQAAAESGSSEGHTVGIIGAGTQARNQLWALRAAIDVAEVRIFSPTAPKREALAARAREEWGLRASAADSARQAVTGASVVVLATTATSPVIEANWLNHDVLVHTLGAEHAAGAEYPDELLTGAYVVSDAPEQARANPHCRVPRDQPIVSLGAIAAGRKPAPADGRRVYLSRGLAGTEVALLNAVSVKCAGG